MAIVTNTATVEEIKNAPTNSPDRLLVMPDAALLGKAPGDVLNGKVGEYAPGLGYLVLTAAGTDLQLPVEELETGHPATNAFWLRVPADLLGPGLSVDGTTLDVETHTRAAGTFTVVQLSAG